MGPGLALLVRLALLPDFIGVSAEAATTELGHRVEALQHEARLLNRKLTLNNLISIQPHPFYPRSAPSLASLGQPILLHLWSVNCPPCRKELPELMSLFVSLQAATPIRVVLITEDSLATLEDFLQDASVKLPAAELYAIGAANHLRVELQQAPLPSTFLVDGHMVVRQAFIGPLINRRNELLSAVERLCITLNASCRKPQ